MALGLRGAERRWGFDRPKRPLGRPIGFNGARCVGQRRGPGGRAREAEFPAQAQVAAWARGSAREGRVGCGPWAVLGRNSKEQEPVFFFPFSRKLKM